MAAETHSFFRDIRTMNRGAYYKQKYGNRGNRGDTGHKRLWEQQQNMPGPGMKADLEHVLWQINRKNYACYQSLANKGHGFPFPLYTLRFDKVQKDPFAPPSRVRIFIDRTIAGFPQELYSDKDTCTATSNYLLRRFSEQLDVIRCYSKDGSFQDLKGGVLDITKPGQEILEQNSLLIHKGDIEVRLTFSLPGRGRSVASERAIEMLIHKLPDAVNNALRYQALDPTDLHNFVTCYQDQQSLRNQLRGYGLVAFIPDGAILPRRSGASDLPMDASHAAAFVSPASLRVSIVCLSGKKITGMGLCCGVTMITGGGYHGKSTLLSAIERGIYNHIPGDGREYLVCDPTLTRIKAEDGRSIQGTDISPFINNLPFGTSTKNFTTTNASGSTSMAASVQEMVEIGSRALIYDEDSCATNFMIRDKRMQMIVQKKNEPITPLIYKVRMLYEEKGVSTILVVGSCGDYLDVSDRIIEMRNYEPIDITGFAKEIAAQYPRELANEGGDSYGSSTQRNIVIPAYTALKCTVRTKHCIVFDKSEELSLAALESIAEISQTQWIASAIASLYRQHNGNGTRNIHTLQQMVDALEEDLDQAVAPGPHEKTLRSPLDAVLQHNDSVHGNFSRPTRCQVVQAINRLRGLKSMDAI